MVEQVALELAAGEMAREFFVGASVVIADPIEPRSALKLGKALGDVSEEGVHLREQAGELFSIVRPQLKRGREYPAFQAWPGITGAPLATVRSALGDNSGPAAYGFFTSPRPELAGLTPTEVLISRMTNPRKFECDVAALLAVPYSERLNAVMAAAKVEASELAA